MENNIIDLVENIEFQTKGLLNELQLFSDSIREYAKFIKVHCERIKDENRAF